MVSEALLPQIKHCVLQTRPGFRGARLRHPYVEPQEGSNSDYVMGGRKAKKCLKPLQFIDLEGLKWEDLDIRRSTQVHVEV